MRAGAHVREEAGRGVEAGRDGCAGIRADVGRRAGTDCVTGAGTRCKGDRWLDKCCPREDNEEDDALPDDADADDDDNALADPSEVTAEARIGFASLMFLVVAGKLPLNSPLIRDKRS